MRVAKVTKRAQMGMRKRDLKIKKTVRLLLLMTQTVPHIRELKESTSNKL